MGWDGICDFEELVDGHWLPLGRADVQTLVYRVAGSLHSSFTTNRSQDREDHDSCEFLWSDLLSASEDEMDDGHFRSSDEILEHLIEAEHFDLVEALLDEARAVRVACSICW